MNSFWRFSTRCAAVDGVESHLNQRRMCIVANETLRGSENEDLHLISKATNCTCEAHLHGRSVQTTTISTEAEWACSIGEIDSFEGCAEPLWTAHERQNGFRFRDNGLMNGIPMTSTIFASTCPVNEWTRLAWQLTGNVFGVASVRGQTCLPHAYSQDLRGVYMRIYTP